MSWGVGEFNFGGLGGMEWGFWGFVGGGRGRVEGDGFGGFRFS